MIPHEPLFPLGWLSWLGRQGTRAVAALVVLGIALPSVGQWLKPHVTEAIFLLLTLAFLRVDTAAFKGHLKRPGQVLAGTAWTALAIPALFGTCSMAFGFKTQSPELFLALMLQAITAPMMSGPALAALMGLDATLVLATLVTSTALIPLTAPLFAHLFIGGGPVRIEPWAVGAKLAAILAGSALLAFCIRRIAGVPAIARQHDRLNGANILVLFVFLAAMMDGVGARFLSNPVQVLNLTLLAFAAFLVLLVATTLLFIRAGRKSALSLGFMASQRNMGLMLAATGGAVPELTWLYFALAQLPVYLSPQLLRPLARRLLGPPTRG